MRFNKKTTSWLEKKARNKPLVSTTQTGNTSFVGTTTKKQRNAGQEPTDISSTVKFQKSGSRVSKPEEEFFLQIKAARVDVGVEREYLFHPTRKWRFDFAWPEMMIAVEIEGGIWNGGRHTRGLGFEKDCQKYLEAVMRGWKIIRATPSMVRSGQLLNAIDALIGGYMPMDTGATK